MLIKETRSADMERDNKVTVLIDSKNSSDALEVYKAITAALQKRTAAVTGILAIELFAAIQKKGDENKKLWRIEEFIAECFVPAVMGLIGSFVGMAIAHWLGLM